MLKLNRSKKTVISSIIIIFLIVVSVILGIDYISTENRPLTKEKDESTISITVNNGDTLYGVFEKLKEENIMPNVFFAKVYLKLNHISDKIMVGDYTINTNVTLKELVNILQSGIGTTKKITFPEGYTVEEIAQTLQENGIIKADSFLKAVKNYNVPSYITLNNEKKYNLEGFLFPDTYSFNENENADFVVKTMINRFEEVWQELVQSLNLSIADDEIEKIVNVASIIEKEAVVDSERSLISSVIYNRIAIEMPLQIDATVIYSYGYHIEKMYEKHLEIDSPYNTYMYYGLPIGPISNPGRASLMAALKPEKTDYLYYLLESEYTHYFTDNYDDFLRRKEELGY